MIKSSSFIVTQFFQFNQLKISRQLVYFIFQVKPTIFFYSVQQASFLSSFGIFTYHVYSTVFTMQSTLNFSLHALLNIQRISRATARKLWETYVRGATRPAVWSLSGWEGCSWV